MTNRVEVSRANIVETAEWCDGAVRACDAGRTTGLYIQVDEKVTKWDPKFRAFIGDEIERVDNEWRITRLRWSR